MAEIATMRLRKTFKYPDINDVPEAMDEEEQEKLIARLKEENSEKNADWMRLFLGLTMFTMALFIPCFLRSICKKPPVNIGLMSITSLFATAYNLCLVPSKLPSKVASSKDARRVEIELTPAQRYVPYLNLALAVLISWSGMNMKGNREVFDSFWIICQVPLGMYGVIFVVKRFLVEVDPMELEQMKYEWKGA